MFRLLFCLNYVNNEKLADARARVGANPHPLGRNGMAANSLEAASGGYSLAVGPTADA
jgi:hypothetical protein